MADAGLKRGRASAGAAARPPERLAERPPPPPLTTEIRLNDDGTLDEVVAWGFVHLEQMSNQEWALLIDTADGKLLRVPIYAKGRGRVLAFAEQDGASDLWSRLVARQQAVVEAAVAYTDLWRIVHDSDPRPPTQDERVQIGYVRGHLFAAVADYRALTPTQQDGGA